MLIIPYFFLIPSFVILIIPFSPRSRSESGSSTSRYRLRVIQQPLAARACGFGERDRRVVDPPPILQLSLRNYDPTSSSDVAELRNTQLVASAALVDARSGGDVTLVPQPNNADRMSRQLTGASHVSPVAAPDLDSPDPKVGNGTLKAYFLFADLSCRMVGRYRLHFFLVKVDEELLQLGGGKPVIQEVESDVFEVFSAKDFPGMRASTALTRHLKNYGANVSVKKGNENRAGRSHGQSDSGGEEEEEDKKKTKKLKLGDRNEGGDGARGAGGLAEAQVEG